MPQGNESAYLQAVKDKTYQGMLKSPEERKKKAAKMKALLKKRRAARRGKVKTTRAKLKGSGTIRTKEVRTNSKKEVSDYNKKLGRKSVKAGSMKTTVDPRTGHVEDTKGGSYPEYKKGTQASKSFKGSFRAARKAVKKTFDWDGRKYTTALK